MNLDKLKEAARKFEQKEQWRQAIDVYKRALKEFEDAGAGVPDPSLYNRIGDLEIKSGDATAAIRAYEQAADLYTEQGFFNNAIALCGKILRVNPGRTPTYLRLAQLNARKNFAGEARKSLLEYIERMDALQHREEALQAVRAFAEQFSSSPDMRLMLMELLRDSSRTEEAREQLEKLAGELDARGDTTGARLTREKLQAIDRGPRPGGGSDLVFIDTGVPVPELPGARGSRGSDATLEPGRARGDAALPGAGGTVETLGVEHTALVTGPVAWEAEATEVERLHTVERTLRELEVAEEVTGLEPSPFAGAGTATGELVAPLEDIDAFPVLEPGSETPQSEASLVDDPFFIPLQNPEVDLPGPMEDLELETAGEELVPLTLEEEIAEAGGHDPGLVFLEVETDRESGEAPSPPVAEDDYAVNLRDRGRLLLEIGDRTGGIGTLEASLQRLEAQERWEEAMEVADDLIRSEPEAIFRYQKRVELAIRSGNRQEILVTYVGLADALLRAGGVEHAVNVYRRILEHDPQNRQAREALARLEQGSAGLPGPLQPTDLPGAAASPGSFVDLGALILDEPQVRDTRMRVDQPKPIENEDQAFVEALEQFKRGIEENLDAEDFQAHYDLGVAFKEMGLLDEAIAQFQKALRSPEGRLKTSEQLGIAFFQKDRVAIAEAVLRRAIEGLPGADDEKIGLIYWLGRALEAQHRAGEALAFYERALAVDIRFLDLGERVQRLGQDRNG